MYDNTFTLRRFFICLLVFVGGIAGLWIYGWRTHYVVNVVEDQNNDKIKVSTPFTMRANDVDIASPYYVTKAGDSVHQAYEQKRMTQGKGK